MTFEFGGKFEKLTNFSFGIKSSKLLKLMAAELICQPKGTTGN
jgi:hypothetical protein